MKYFFLSFKGLVQKQHLQKKNSGNKGTDSGSTERTHHVVMQTITLLIQAKENQIK